MGLRFEFDKWLVLGLIVLIIFGIWTISSVSVYNSYTKEINNKAQEYCQTQFVDDPSCYSTIGKEYAQIWCDENNCNNLYLKRQIRNVMIGIMAMIIAYIIPIKWWRMLAMPAFLCSFSLLIIVLFLPIPAGYTAKSWISVPIFGTIQPAEFMKMSLILYFSLWLEKREKNVETLQSGFYPFVALLGLTTIPVMIQPDFGSTSILIAIAVSIFFLAGGRIMHLWYAFLLGLVLIVFASIMFGYIRERLATFFDSENVSDAASYQIEQSYLSIGNGGLLGAGDTTQSFGYLPEIQGDMIFAAVSEQMGFIGMILVLGIYLLIIIRGILIAKKAPDRFSFLVSSGIVAWFMAQSLVNMFVVTGIFPLTGITLPLLSYGGSSILMTLLSMGVLLKISTLSPNWYGKDFNRRGRNSRSSLPLSFYSSSS